MQAMVEDCNELNLNLSILRKKNHKSEYCNQCYITKQLKLALFLIQNPKTTQSNIFTLYSLIIPGFEFCIFLAKFLLQQEILQNKSIYHMKLMLIPKQTANKIGYTLAIVTFAKISLQNDKTDLHWMYDIVCIHFKCEIRSRNMNFF